MTVFSLQIDGPVALLRIEREAARNAIPLAGWRELERLCGEISQSDARVVLLHSSVAGIFSAGADIGEFPAFQANARRASDFRETMARSMGALAALSVPVIVAVDGGCFGAAVALTLACDICIAGDDASFATTPAKLGLSYPASDVARLIERVGRGRASAMLFSGERVYADRALTIGLADIRAPSAKAEAHELARRIAANAPGAIADIKQVLRAPDAAGHDARFDARFASDELAERLKAFQEHKRS